MWIELIRGPSKKDVVLTKQAFWSRWTSGLIHWKGTSDMDGGSWIVTVLSQGKIAYEIKSRLRPLAAGKVSEGQDACCWLEHLYTCWSNQATNMISTFSIFRSLLAPQKRRFRAPKVTREGEWNQKGEFSQGQESIWRDQEWTNQVYFWGLETSWKEWFQKGIHYGTMLSSPIKNTVVVLLLLFTDAGMYAFLNRYQHPIGNKLIPLQFTASRRRLKQTVSLWQVILLPLCLKECDYHNAEGNVSKFLMTAGGVERLPAWQQWDKQ